MITSGTGHWRNDGFGTHMVFPAVLKQEIWHRSLHPSRNGLLAFIQRLEGFRLEKGDGGQWSVMNWWLLLLTAALTTPWPNCNFCGWGGVGWG